MPKPVRLTLMIIPWILILGGILWYFSSYLALRFIAIEHSEIVSARLIPRLLGNEQQPIDAGSYYYKEIAFILPATRLEAKQGPVGMVFSDPANKSKRLIVSENSGLKELATSSQSKVLQSLIESKGIQTDYDYEKYMLELTLDSVSPFNRLDTVLAIYFLTLKQTSVTNPPLYSFKTPTVKGFQMGDPQVGTVKVDVFASNDYEYQMLFQGYSQPEIDQVILSIRNK